MPDLTCAVEGCDRPVKTRGWCNRHYSRWRRRGDANAPYQRQQRPGTLRRCTVEGCSGVHVARGWCQTHWGRWKMYGDPMIERPPSAACAAEGCQRRTRVGFCVNHRHRIHGTTNHRCAAREYVDLPDGTTQLTMVMHDGAEFVTVFDTVDRELLQGRRWTVTHQGYVIAGQGVRMHRLILGLTKGDGLTGDHINGDHRDNRRCNLRATSNQRNVAHQAVVNHRGSSRFRNVYRERTTGRWNAEVWISRKKHWLGTFDAEEDAAARVAEFRVEHGLPSGY